MEHNIETSSSVKVPHTVASSSKVTAAGDNMHVAGPYSQSVGLQMGYEPTILSVTKVGNKSAFLIQW